jgi:glucose/arabinose dehydrogenase
MTPRAQRATVASILALTTALLGGCAADGGTLNPTFSAVPSPPAADGVLDAGPVAPIGEPTIVASGLNVPWSIVVLPNGSALISERMTGNIVEVRADHSTTIVGTVPGVAPMGEGGLLGLALYTVGDRSWVYAYFTANGDNRIVRMELTGDTGTYSLSTPTVILSGLAKAANHDGGRLAFGPDGMLYATVGDAQVPERAQDLASLNGKILRMTPEGTVPSDNPFPNSLVYSYGHRNPQGITWDADGTMWASEFGQDRWDELNEITAGSNYGWPIVEGVQRRTGFVDPIYAWHPEDASPSGLVWVHNTLFMTSLRGERLWVISGVRPAENLRVTSWFEATFGRVRDASVGPDGSLWFITSNTDGRGDPRDGDDKLYSVTIDVAGGG